MGAEVVSFRFACSVALWGAGAADRCHWPVWGALAVFGHAGFAPARGGCVCSPHLHCSGSRLLSRERALRCMDFPGQSRSDSGSPVLHTSTDSAGPAFCAFPGQSISGRQELDDRTLPGCRAPSPLRGPHLSFRERRPGAPCVCFGELDSSCDPSSGCQPSRISRKSLVQSWKPVCSLVGDAVSGAEFAPFPSPLPPAFGGGWAGPLPGSSSGICSVLHSGNQRVVPKFRAFPKLILSRYPTV